MKLVNELFNFCGMQANDPPHSEICLHVALSQNDPVDIHRVFTNKEIPSLESLRFANDVAADDHDWEDDDEGLPRYSNDIWLNSEVKARPSACSSQKPTTTQAPTFSQDH